MSDYEPTNGDAQMDNSSSLLDRAIEAVRSQPPGEEALLTTLDRVRVSVAPAPPRRLPALIRRRWLVTAAAAAAVMAAATAWLWHPSVSWAEVAEALRGKPWIHGVAQPAGGEVSEFWFSADRDAFGDRRGDWARFTDLRLNVCYEYDPKEQHILRTVPPERPGLSLAAFFEAIIGGQMRVGSVFEGQEVVAQEERRIVEDGRQWLEYDVKTRAAQDLASNRLTLMRFRLDPESHLPHSMSISMAARTNGAEQGFKYVFDYPDEGPRDIYDLSVPRTARLIDRVPTADFARLFAAVEAGRSRFDSYFAIAVEQQGKDQPWHEGGHVTLVWRKGNRWRVELGFPKSRPTPEADVDRLQWWKEHLQSLGPIELCDGRTIYRVEHGPASDSWQALSTIDPKRAIDEAGHHQARMSMPELFGYPISLEDKKHLFTARLENQANDGPPDSLLVRYEATSAVTEPRAFREMRYWVDPGKGYVLLKEVLSGARDPDGSTTTVSSTLEDLRQSPCGIWYPGLVREKVVRSRPDGTNSEANEKVTRFFVDFAAELPDELFRAHDPPTTALGR